MAKSTAQRQAAYRSKSAGTHKRVELVLDGTTYKKLQTLVRQSVFRTRIDYITALIVKEYKALSGHDLLPDTPLSSDPAGDTPTLARNSQKTAVPGRRPAKKKPRKVIEIWHGDNRCQGQTARGAHCRVKHHLSIIPYRLTDLCDECN